MGHVSSIGRNRVCAKLHTSKQSPSTQETTAFPQPSALATRGAADDGRAFRTGEDPGLYARFRWEYARHDPHKPHRHVALRAVRLAHEQSSAPLPQRVIPPWMAARFSTPD